MSINEDLWEFPHRMQLKVMGASDSPLEQAVAAILDRYLDDFSADNDISITPSSKGNYISVTASVVMRDKEQVSAIYAALNGCEHVKVVF